MISSVLKISYTKLIKIKNSSFPGKLVRRWLDILITVFTVSIVFALDFANIVFDENGLFRNINSDIFAHIVLFHSKLSSVFIDMIG